MPYSFSRSSFKGLKDAAAEAVQRIYENGLTLGRNNRADPGHNNMRADNAAKAFSSEDLECLSQSTDPLEQKFSQMIRLRQDHIGLHVDDPKGKILLQNMYDLGQDMKTLGWQPRSELGTSHSVLQSSFDQSKVSPPSPPDHTFEYDSAQYESLARGNTPKP